MRFWPKWIAELRKARPAIRIEMRWCPAHSGVEGNEKADEGAKQAAGEPDARGVEWLKHGDRYGARRMPPPRSLANLKREISEKKWAEAQEWAKESEGEKVQDVEADEQRGGASPQAAGGPVSPDQNEPLPDGAVPEMDEERGHGRVRMVRVQSADTRALVQALCGLEDAAEDSVGRSTKGDKKREESSQDPRPVSG